MRDACGDVRSPFVTSFDYLTFLTDYGLEDGFVAASAASPRRLPRAPASSTSRTWCRPATYGAARPCWPRPFPTCRPRCTSWSWTLASGPPGAAWPCRRESVLVGPDNGVLSWAIAGLGGADRAVQLTNGELWLHPVSPTFHGRDIFMPAAAHLAAGADLEMAGTEIKPAELVTLPAPTSRVRDGEAEGEVMSVDRFGNVQLSIPAAEASRLGVRFGAPLVVRCGRRQLTVPYLETFAAVAPGEIVAFTDSAGLISLAVNAGDAAQQLGLPPGAHVGCRSRTSPEPPALSCRGLRK